MVTSVQCLQERSVYQRVYYQFQISKFQEAKSDYLGQLIVTPERC